MQRTSGATLPGSRARLPLAAPTLAAIVLGVSLVSVHAATSTGANSFDLRATLLTLTRVGDPVALPFVVVAILIVGGWAERIMGGARLLVAYAGGGVVTSTAGLIVGVWEAEAFPAVPLGETPVAGASPGARSIGRGNGGELLRGCPVASARAGRMHPSGRDDACCRHSRHPGWRFQR